MLSVVLVGGDRARRVDSDTTAPFSLSHPLLTTAKGSTATGAKKEDAETKQHKENTREYLADRRTKELRLPSVLSSHYSVSVSLQGVHYL
jgi:hypothetical protein